MDQWSAQRGPLWVHLDRRVEQAREWLRDRSGLDPVVCDALLAEDSRPRCTMMSGGAIVMLRGVNLNPGAEPDDMISFRMWVEAHRLISVRSSRLMAAADVRDEVRAGAGPATPGQLLTQLAWRLADRIAPVIENLDQIIDELEEQAIEMAGAELRRRLGAMRRQAIALRRYIAPQRDALSHLMTAQAAWLDDRDMIRLREVMDRTTRYVEDLDALRERAALVQEEVAGRQAEQMNRTMYMVALVATIFLPLGLLTGLLGINVGGIPGVDDPWAFGIVCVLLVLTAVIELAIFKRKKLL